MVVELGIVNVDVMDLRGRSIRFLNEAADLPTRLGPRCDLSRVTTQIALLQIHVTFPYSILRNQNQPYRNAPEAAIIASGAVEPSPVK
jgi:hypothetical protein